MATATVLMPILSASLDASNPPGVEYVNSDARLLFDDTTPEACYWKFRLPQNYSADPVFKLQLAMASAVAGLVDFEASIMAVSDGDAQDLDTDSFDTVNSANATVPGTAGYMDELSITLSNIDSMVAGDWVKFKLERDADDATNDTATGDAELHTVSLEYTFA